MVEVEVPDRPPVADDRSRTRASSFGVVHEDDDVVVVDKPAGLVVHPGAGNAAGHAGARPARPVTPRWPAVGRAGPARHRAPARPGHVGPAGRGPHRGRLRRRSSAQLAARAGGAAVPRPRVGHARRPTPGLVDAPIGRSAAAPTRMAVSAARPGGADPLRGRASVRPARRARRCCAAGSRPDAPTRSGCTWPPSATRSSATPPTAAAAPVVDRAPAVPARQPAGLRPPASGARVVRSSSARPRRGPDRLAEPSLGSAVAARERAVEPLSGRSGRPSRSSSRPARPAGGQSGQRHSPRAMSRMSARVWASRWRRMCSPTSPPRWRAARTGPRGRRRRPGGARRSRRRRSVRRRR